MSNKFSILPTYDDDDDNYDIEKTKKKNKGADNTGEVGNQKLTRKEIRAQDLLLREHYGDTVQKDVVSHKRNDNPMKPKDDWISGEKRPFERHSANGKPYSKNYVKKGGHGKGNIGSLNEQAEGDETIEAPEDQQFLENEELIEKTNDIQDVNIPSQRQRNQEDVITLDQYVQEHGISIPLETEKTVDEEGARNFALNTRHFDADLRIHAPKKKEQKEYHHIARNPDSIFVPSTNIAVDLNTKPLTEQMMEDEFQIAPLEQDFDQQNQQSTTAQFDQSQQQFQSQDQATDQFTQFSGDQQQREDISINKNQFGFGQQQQGQNFNQNQQFAFQKKENLAERAVPSQLGLKQENLNVDNASHTSAFDPSENFNSNFTIVDEPVSQEDPNLNRDDLNKINQVRPGSNVNLQ